MSSLARQQVPEGYKQTEVGVIPNDWRIVFVGDVADVKTGPFGSALHERDYVVDGTPIITVEHLGELGVTYQNLPMVSDFDRKRLCAYALRKGDIAFSRVGSIDRNALIRENEDGWLFSGRLLRVRLNGAENNSEYISYHFHSSPFKRRVVEVAVGQTMPSLNTSILKGIKILLPSVKGEQTAIANALSDVDALITSLEKLIAKKRAIKTAAMQQLLTGKKRLPPFDKTHTGYKQTELGEIPGDWEVKQFSEIATPKSNRTNPKITGGGDFCIELEHVDQGTATVNGSTLTTLDSSLKSIFSEGDVLFGKLRSYLRKYWLADRNGVCSTEFWVLNANELHVISQFVFQLIQTDRFIDCTSESYGTHMPRSDWKVVKSFLVATPSIDEQIAIANMLFNMGEEIVTLERRLTKTQQLKQGMMQELLTGRTRLI